MTNRKFLIALGPALTFVASSAHAATYQVGPSRSFTTVDQVLSQLQPGDVVEIDGNATYPGDLTIEVSGTKAQPITFKGIRVNGARPVFSGGTNTIHYNASHLIFEAIDVTGGSSRCIFHQGDDITIRDSVIHDCPMHGLLGADEGSGSLLMDYDEVYKSGSGDSHHPIYMATDETTFPGSVFRMQHCYVHDGNGGNNVKSRAERNEIYSNWIEGAVYHNIELIGPDGQDEDLAREDSDVVGNVFVKLNSGYMSREGGDGTGETWGRYRFVNNTFVVSSQVSAIFRLFDGIESIEMHNNAVYEVDGATPLIVHDSDATWSTGVAIETGSNNWAQSGATIAPATWVGTVLGTDPGFMNMATDDVELKSGSPLVNAGDMNPQSPSGFPFPNPLNLPTDLPPLHTIQALGTAQPRTLVGVVDIGAYELGDGSGSTTTSGAGGATGASTATTGSGSPSVGSGDATTGSGSPSVGSGNATTGSGSPSVGSGDATTGSGSPSVGSGNATTGSGGPSVGSGQTTNGSGSTTGSTGSTMSSGAPTSGAGGSGGGIQFKDDGTDPNGSTTGGCACESGGQGSSDGALGAALAACAIAIAGSRRRAKNARSRR